VVDKRHLLATKVEKEAKISYLLSQLQQQEYSLHVMQELLTSTILKQLGGMILVET
jgi:hypothetical protein